MPPRAQAGHVSSLPTGFQLSHHLLQLIVLRYADEGLQLDFDDFLNCLVRLENASREWLVAPGLLGPGGRGVGGVPSGSSQPAKSPGDDRLCRVISGQCAWSAAGWGVGVFSAGRSLRIF